MFLFESWHQLGARVTTIIYSVVVCCLSVWAVCAFWSQSCACPHARTGAQRWLYWAALLWFIMTFCDMVHWSAYAANGRGAPAMLAIGFFAQFISCGRCPAFANAYLYLYSRTRICIRECVFVFVLANAYLSLYSRIIRSIGVCVRECVCVCALW